MLLEDPTVRLTVLVSALDHEYPFSGRACMLCEYAHVEVHTTEEGRVVVKNKYWVALVPWWATWPFELMGENNKISAHILS